MAESRITDLLARIPTGIFINGEFTDSSSGERFDVLNPATGEVLTTVADATPEDAARAMDLAAEAQWDWAVTAPRERAEILRRAFDLATGKYRDDLATVMTLEMGKPLDQSYGEVTYGAEFLRWFSEEAARIRGDYFRVPEGHLQAVVVRRPVGPCLFITPWNFPLAMATRKAGPAFAAGNVAIMRPSQDTPLTALLFAQIMNEAGLPKGVFAVLPSKRSRPITGPLIQDPRMRKISFTGSTQVGKALLKEAADNVLRTSMELGGNAPFIVFEDADIDKAVEAAVATKLRNMGEACNAADHFFVHTDVYEEFAEKFTARIAAKKVGNGLEDGVDVGPLVSEKQLEDVSAMIDRAVEAGAKIAAGGGKPFNTGFFLEPTVLVDVDPESDIVKDEIFGPVAPVIRFEDEAELIKTINKDSVGLGGYFHTKDMNRVMRLAERLEIGMLGVNSATISNAGAPFGGMKHSGMGREGGKEGIEDYLQTVYVGMPAPDFF
ncbi:succinate-semialdehyde dehydrogenase/glutarate-semialdehyde dehydrogenase [Trueperella bonasi]|uniref:Succinate-semialdehyde dehydrogenase/glutarate-semialdehyde dehydrogenase n=1 Tax=Trueperella bonasi TaxID=312286 RepID=A0ABT9NGZ8_9ACTO|nr:NAD-dependent succinate-semialdehyde dehydrogenase [Trueperella bonasi]MDP9806457.1 succinate-semialdehyde dehydrogenase/glutarate-semialdehyde dehydrogenase [Trueperella bonasi]